MAPETANQKRKRGRPAATSRDNQGTSEDRNTAQLPVATRRGKSVTQNDAADVDMASQAQPPKKRGRPSLAPPNSEQAVPEAQTEPKQSGKRKRRQKEETTTGGQTKRRQIDPNPDTIPDAQPPIKRKRGRPSLTKDAGGEASADRAETELQSPKRKGRRSKADLGQPNKGIETAAEEADDETEKNSSALRRSPRDRRNKDGSPQSSRAPAKQSRDKAKRKGKEKADEQRGPAEPAEADQEPAQSQPKQKQKRTRTSPRRQAEDREAEEQQADNESPKQSKRRGRPGTTKDSGAKAGKGAARPSNEEEVGKKGKRKSQAPSQPENSKEAEAEAEEVEGEGEDEEADDSSSSAGSTVPRKQPPHRHALAQRVRRVPRATIEEKWSPLDDASIASVTNLLHSASRPVLHRLSNLQRHALATQALNAASNRVRSKLSRGLPFPAATNISTSSSRTAEGTSSPRIEDLEFERTISRVEALQAQLEPLLHGVSVLRRERDRAERQLAKDHRFLNHLSGNARGALRERREQEKKMHVLVPEPPSSSVAPPGALRKIGDREDDHDRQDNGNGLMGSGVDKLAALGSLFSAGDQGDQGDERGEEELKLLATQLGNHMESMRGNLGQIDGVTPAVEQGKAALRAALLPHLGREGLERVILG